MNKIASQDEFEEALTAVPFTVKPRGRSLGAEIIGLDLKDGLDDATVRAFEATLIKYKVVYLREQFITPAEQIAITKKLGTLESNPFRPTGDVEQIMVLDNHKDNPVLSTDVWHADMTFKQQPTKYAILRCDIMPETGGDTLWADMAAAYRGLSEPFRKMIDGLKARHDFQNFRVLFKKTDEDQKRLREMEARFPNPSHPVVRTHPVTGEKCIYVNRQFVLFIEDLAPDESKALLELLYAQVQYPEYQFRLRWEPGTIAFWDNTCTQHYASNDYYPERRRMERTSTEGEVPA
ncbi:MAG: hypothetical protein RLZ98_1762 [Pseudomonadota bacterium]|jgi:taurine dioxygenase